VIRIFMDDGDDTFELFDPYVANGRGQAFGILDEEGQFDGFVENLSWPLTTYDGEPWREYTQAEYDALPKDDPAMEWGRDGYVYCPGVWRETTTADLIALNLVAEQASQ
jgi:hypothetical protein